MHGTKNLKLSFRCECIT